MRELTEHKVNGLNEALRVTVLDEPGAGGACHKYLIHTDDMGPNCAVGFQNGPIAKNGVNGISQEALLVIVIDRLRGFQSGEYKCRDNACALTHLEEALMWMQKRTRDRMARGVEGTSQK